MVGKFTGPEPEFRVPLLLISALLATPPSASTLPPLPPDLRRIETTTDFRYYHFFRNKQIRFYQFKVQIGDKKDDDLELRFQPHPIIGGYSMTDTGYNGRWSSPEMTAIMKRYAWKAATSVNVNTFHTEVLAEVARQKAGKGK